MQGRQNMSSTERKGPHKSMHCKFCKPPGVTTPEKPTRAQLETKTKIHLTHEAADLRLSNIHNEPGFPAVESEACICVLEGENSCPKCLPDKSRSPPKKKACRCPKGAKPHPSMYNEAAPKKKKQVEEDDEFWWEKYSREHDALAKETWAAYMAQRRKEKKLEKCQRREKQALIANKIKGAPNWYQKLSCQQMIYVEYLSTAIRLDSDENITDRTFFVLGGIGLYPRPNRKILKRCLRYCHYNSIQFLNQLHLLIKEDDPFEEKVGVQSAEFLYTWNERLIMNSLCHLEFPALLREVMDRLPQLPRKQMLPQIPYPVFPGLPKKKYDNPYEEPIWQDRLNWVEKMKIDRLNRCRVYMETKRVKIPALALVRRPSLIDARPPFLAQIEANERASRRLVKEKQKKPLRKHQISTFNSAVDVTAIAGIEASEISTTDKADTDDICVFLREPKGPESTEGEIEDETDYVPEKEVKFLEETTKTEETQVNRVKTFPEFDDEEEEMEQQPDNMEFRTPPKTQSGATIESPCPPPDATPGPPASHFERGRRELDIINKEICGFFPFVASSTQTLKEDGINIKDDVELNLKVAAQKLKKLAKEDEEDKKSQKKSKKKHKKKSKKMGKGKSKKPLKKRRPVSEGPDPTKETPDELEEEQEEDEKAKEDNLLDELLEEDETQISFKLGKEKETKVSKRSSELSDPDPDSEDEWSARPPCTTEGSKADSEPPVIRRKTKRRKGKSLKRKPKRKKSSKDKPRQVELKEEKGEYQKKREFERKAEEQAMRENEEWIPKGTSGDEEEEKTEDREKIEVFKGDVGSLVEEIIKDLAEEGFYCASYPLLDKHPDIDQLILYLKGEIITKKLRDKLRMATKARWSQMKGLKKFPVPDLGISTKRLERANWNDKKWISRLGKQKTDQFYFKVANNRTEFGIEFYKTLYQSHFGTDRYLKIFCAYMPSKYEDSILRGIF